jgi:phosphoribosylamine--glycine ligase
VLFAGIMIQDGKPRLLEYNVRFGDPECQTLMMRLQSDLLPLLEAAADGTLDKVRATRNPPRSRTIVSRLVLI